MNKQDLLDSIMDQVVEGKYSKERIERFLKAMFSLVSIQIAGNPLAEPVKDNIVDLAAYRQQRNGESDI